MPDLGSYYKKLFEQKNRNSGLEYIKTTQEYLKKKKEEEEEEKKKSQTQKLLDSEKKKQEEQNQKGIENKNLSTSENNTDLAQKIQDKVSKNIYAGLLKEEEKQNKINEVKNKYSEISAGYDFILKNPDLYDDEELNGNPDKGFILAERYKNLWLKSEEILNRQTDTQDRLKAQRKKEVGFLIDELYEERKRAKKFNDTKRVAKIDEKIKELRKERPLATGIRWLDNLGPTIKEVKNASTNFDGGKGGFWFFSADSEAADKDLAEYNKVMAELKKYSDPYYKLEQTSSRASLSEMGFDDTKTKLGILLNRRGNYEQSEHYQKWLAENPEPSYTSEKFNINQPQDAESAEHRAWRAKKDEQVSLIGHTAENHLERERQATRALEHFDRSAIVKMGSGALDALDNVITAGINDVITAKMYAEIEDKARNGVELTELEKEFAVSKIKLDEIRNMRQNEITNWEVIGEQGAHSVSFILQMGYSPAALATRFGLKTLSKQGAKYATKEVLEEGAKQTIKDKLKMGAAKVAASNTLNEAEKIGLKGGAKYFSYLGNKVVEVPATSLSGGFTAPMAWQSYYEKYTGDWIVTDKDAPNGLGGVLIMEQGQAERFLTEAKNAIDIKKNNIAIFYNTLEKYANAVTIDEYRKVGSIESLNPEFINKTEGFFSTFLEKPNENFVFLELKAKGYLPENAVPSDITTEMLNQYIINEQNQINTIVGIMSTIGTPTDSENGFFNTPRSQAFWYGQVDYAYEALSEKSGDLIGEFLKPIKKAADKNIFIKSVKESKPAKYLDYFNTSMENLSNRFYGTSGLVQSVPLELVEELDRNLMKNPFGTEKEYEEQIKQYNDPNFYLQVLGATLIQGGVSTIIRGGIDVASGGYKQTVNAIRNQNIYNRLKTLSDSLEKGDITSDDFITHIGGVLKRNKQYGAIEAASSDLQKLISEEKDKKRQEKLSQSYKLLGQINLITQFDEAFSEGQEDSLLKGIKKGLESQGIDINNNVFYKNLFKYSEEMKKIKNHKFLNDKHKQDTIDTLHNSLLNNIILDNLKESLKQQLKHTNVENFSLFSEEFGEEMLQEILSAKNSEEFDSLAKKHNLSEEDKLEIQGYVVYEKMLDQKEIKNNESYSLNMSTDEKSLEYLKSKYKIESSDKMSSGKNNAESVVSEGKNDKNIQSVHNEEVSGESSDVTRQLETLTKDLDDDSYILYNGKYFGKSKDGTLVKVDGKKLPTNAFIKKYEKSGDSLVNIELEREIDENPELAAMRNRANVSLTEEELKDFMAENDEAIQAAMSRLFAPIEDNELDEYDKQRLKNAFLYLIKKYHLSPEEVLGNKNFILSEEEVKYLKEVVSELDNKVDRLTREKWQNLSDNRIKELVKNSKNNAVNTFVETKKAEVQEQMVNKQVQEKRFEQKGNTTTEYNILKVTISKIKGGIDKLTNKKVKIVIADRWENRMITVHNQKIDIIEYLKRKGVNADILRGLSFEGIKEKVESGELSKEHFNIVMSVIPLQGNVKDSVIEDIIPSSLNPRYNFFNSIVREVQDILRNNKYPLVLEEALQNLKNAVLNQSGELEALKSLEQLCEKHGISISNLIKAHQDVSSSALSLIKKVRQEVAEKGESKLLVKKVSIGLPEINEQSSPVLFSEIDGNKNFRFVSKRTNKNNESREVFVLVDVKTGNKIPHKVIANWDLVSTQYHAKPFVLIPTGRKIIVDILKNGKKVKAKVDEQYCVFIDDTRVPFENPLMKNFLDNIGFIYALINHDFSIPDNKSFTYGYKGKTIKLSEEQAQQVINQIYNGLGFSNDAKYRNKEYLENYLDTVYSTLIDESYNDEKLIRINFLKTGNEDLLLPMFNIIIDSNDGVSVNQEHSDMTISNFRLNVLSTKCKIENGNVVLEDFVELVDDTENNTGATTNEEKQKPVVKETKVVNDSKTNEDVSEEEAEQETEQEEDSTEDVVETEEDSLEEVIKTDTETSENSSTKEKEELDKKLLELAKKDSENLFKINTYIKNTVFRKFALKRSIKISEVYREAQKVLDTLIKSKPEGSEERIFLEKNRDKILAVKDSNNYVTSVRKMIDDFFQVRKSLTDDYLGSVVETDVQEEGYNVEAVYGKQSFEQDVTVSISTQVKMFLSGLSLLKDGIFYSFSERECYSALQEAMAASDDHTLESCLTYLQQRVQNCKSSLKLINNSGEEKSLDSNLKVFEALIERLEEIVNIDKDDPEYDIKMKLKREIEYSLYNNKVAMSFVYCYKNVFSYFNPTSIHGVSKRTVKESTILDANRRNALSKKSNALENNFRNLLYYDKKLRKFVFDINKIKELKWFISKFQNEYQKAGIFVQNGRVNTSVFEDLKHIFNLLGIELDDNTIIELFNNRPDENGVNPLEINAKKKHGYVIKYLTNLIEKDGQITKILEESEKGNVYIVDYVGGDSCFWSLYNTKTKKVDKPISKPILQYNGKNSSGKAIAKRLLKEDLKYTFNPVPGIYVGEKRVNSFENVRYINKQFSLIIEGLRNKIYNQESKNKRAKTLLDNLKKTSFSKYSFLLSLVEKCPEFLNNLSLEWTSLEAFVIKDKTNNNKDDADFTKLSEKDQITSALAYFIGGIYGKPIYTDASGFDYYATQFTFPALSDASVLPVIKTGAVFFTNSQLNTQNIDSSNKIFSDVNVRKLLFDTLVKGELSRIIDHVFGNKTSNVSGMNNGSLLFTLVPSINAIRSGDVSILGRIREYANSGMAKEEAFEKVAKEFQNLIDTELYGFVHKKSGDLFNKLISNNIITFEKGSVKKVEGFISDKFLNRFGDKVSLTDKISNLCLNFTINHLIATSDIYKLFSGDLACYNTDKMLSKYFFGKDVDTPNFDLLIDLYIEKKYSSEKAKLYKDAISDDIKFNALNDKDREVVMELRQYRNPQSMLYNTLLRKAYSDYIEYSLQNNLSKRLKGMIGNGKILSGTAQANTFSEAYEIMLTDVNSISKSVRFYYHNHYENSSELSPVEKELVLQDIAILESLENKKTLGKNQKIEYQNAKKRLMDRLPDIAEYLDIADTDGQEYSTWRNHLQQLLLQGRLTDAEYDIIYKKLESQSKLMKITPENKLTKGELRLALMQPTKPVHFGMYFRQEGGDTNGYTDQNMVYIKTSSFPLIPQLTKGFEIDKLRTVMEKLEKSGDGTRTARTSYNSGNKVGGLNSAMTFDQICSFYKQSPNKLVETLKDTYTIIDLSNYLIQQDKPFETFENLEEGKSDYIIRGTQMEKSIGSDGIFDIEEKIFPAEDFSLQTLKDCNIVNEGATRENLSDLKVSGKDLKRIYEYLYEKEQEILKRKLFDKFGITDYSELNEPHVKEKIKKVLDQRLDNNQDLEGIQIFHKFDIVEDDGTIKHYELSSEEFRGLSEQTKSKMLNYSYDFNIAIWTLPNYKKFESVLNSVVSNNSIRLKLPGGHGIVASQKGFEFLEQENYNGDVILTENFDGELKAVRDKDGKLLAAQVFMASKFRKFNPDTNSFELIDLNEYVIEKDGRRYLDNERVPENIRQMFSYRIPTSSHQSGMLIEIVGFLPTECGDLIIVPKDSTKQMGEDFDIDVRYFYQHHIVEYMETDKNEETGEIVEVKKLKMLEQIDPQKNYSKEIRRNYFDFLKTVIETKIKGGNLININDPIYNEFGINYLMRIATILSGDFYGENKTYREEYLQDLKENFGATDETILNIKRLIALIKNNKSLNDLQKYVNQTKYEEFELKSIENDLITLYKSVYKSNTPNVQKKITAVLSTDFLNDTANIISETKRENVDSNGVYSPLSFLSQIGIIKKGNAGKVGIGVWSSLEVFTALVQQCEEPIVFESGMRIGNFEWDGTIGGKFDEESQSYVAMIPENAPEGFKVRTIFRSIMEHQNSATDNQKLQIMEKLNENTHTFPVYEMLTLIGADKDGFKVNDKELSYPALFMCQPIIKDYVSKCEYYNSLSTDTWFNIKKQIITELEKKYGIERNSENVAKNEELTGENLYANLASPNNNIQMAVLNTFFELENMFQQLRPYITQLNLEQKGLGVSFLNTIEKKDFILSIAETKDGPVSGLDQLIGDFKVVGEDIVIDDVLEEDDEEIQEPENNSNSVTFTESTGDYPQRTRENADWSDITIALAMDFTTAGETLTAQQAGSRDEKFLGRRKPREGVEDKYVPATIDPRINLDNLAEGIAASIFEQLDNKGKTKNLKLNIAGNGIYTLSNNYTQEQINNLVYKVLRKLLLNGITISEIRSGGQTGVDEAGIIAAQNLGIKASVHAPKGYEFRDASKKDIFDEKKFKERFNTHQSNKNESKQSNTFIPKSYEGMITPDANTIFVFGSNPEGRHGAGAAKTAKDKFGAVQGHGEGLQGNAYALPTKDLRVKENSSLRSISPAQITENIKKLYDVAKQNPSKQFKVAYTNGLNEATLNGYTGAEMIKMFKDAGPIPSNVVFSKNWTDHWNEVESSQIQQAQQQSQQVVESISTPSNPIQIYSDGSDIKGTGAIGYGAVFEYNGKQYGLSGTETNDEVQKLKQLFPDAKFSNPTMEMLALATTLEYFANRNKGEHIEINQDYKGAVNYNGLWKYSEGSDQREGKPWKAKELYIKHLVDRAEAAIKKIEENGGSVKIRWVKGHSGDKMNDAADSYAKNRDNFNTIDEVYNTRQQSSQVQQNQQQLRITPQVKQLRNHSKHITFDESTHTYYIDGVPADISVTQLFNTSEQEDLDREHLTPMQVGATIGTKVDAIARDFFAGKFSDKNSSEEPLSDKYGVHKNNIEQIVSQLEEAKKLFDKKYGAGEYTIITDENLLRVAGTIQNIDEQGNVVTQTVAGTMDLLIIDKNGDYHIFDFKVKRESTPGNIDLDEKTKIKYKNQGESYAKLLQNIVGNKNKVSFKSDLLLICSYPSAVNNTYSLDENDDLLLKGEDKSVSLKRDSDNFNLGKSFSFVDMRNVPYNKEKVAGLTPPVKRSVLKGSSEKVEELEKNGYVFFAKDPYGRSVYIKPNGFYAHKIVNSVSEGYNMWKNIFPYDEKIIRHIIKSIVENSDVMPYSSSSLKLQYEIVEALQDYLYSSLRCFKNNGSTLTSTRKNMFFDFENNVSFAHYVQDVINSNPKYKNSVFFQNLDFQINLTGKTPSVIIYNTNIERGDEKTAIYEMFKEMFESEEKLPYWNGIEMSESLFARFLVQYAYLSSQNGATSFRKLLPISTFSKIFSITDSGEVLDMKSNMSVITSPLSLEILLEDSSKVLCKLLGSSVNRDNVIVNKKGLSTETVQSLVDRYNTLYNKAHYYVDEIGNIHINSLPKRDGLIKQFFQHNPDKAHKLSSKRFKEEKSKNNGFIPTRIKISDAEVVKLPEFCVFYNEGKLFLYQKDVLTSSLVRINLLGNQYFHEYSFGGNDYSLIEDNNISKEQKEEVEKIKKQQLYKNANDVINEVLSDTENKYYNLAEYLKEVVSLSNTKILYKKCGKKNSALFYDVSNKHIVINVDYNLRKDVLQEKLLHEIFHSLTTDILNSNIEKGGMMFEKGDDGKYHINIKVKEDAPTVIRNLIRVYKDTILALQDSSVFGKVFSAYLDVYSESLNNGELAFNINSIRNGIYKKHPELKEQLSDKEIKDMLYGLYYSSNIFEFVSGIFFNKTLLNKLNNIPVDSNNESLIDRFVKAITKMIDFLKSIMNIDVKSGHALEEVIKDITEIIYMNKGVEDIEDDEDVDSEGVKTDITSASDQSINVFDQNVSAFENAADEYKEIVETLNNDAENLNAPIFTEQDIILGKKVTIDGVHYRMLDINGLEGFSYAVSKVNGVYEISAIQIDDFVTKTKFRHKDFSTLLYEFSKICDTFVKNKGNEFFENPFLFKKGENYNINNINKTYC